MFECRSGQCPNNVPLECLCSTNPFNFNCARDNEEITLKQKGNEFALKTELELNCVKIIDGQIFASLEFSRANNQHINDIRLTINSCPLSVTTLINPSIISQTNLNNLSIIANGLSKLPNNFFNGQEKLKSIDIQGDTITTLPSGIFKRQTLLEMLNLVANKLSAN